MKGNQIENEKIVKKVDDYCSIVERPEMKVVGVKVDVTPNVDMNAAKIVEKSIKEGTCRLLADLIDGCEKDRYIAAATNVKTGIDFTYIIGVIVESFDNLPQILPPDTVTLVIPAACYAKEVRVFDSEDQRHSCSLQAICYLSSSQFRNDSGYVYDKKGIPFRIFNHDAELTLAYEPVKIPQNEDEKYDSVHCEVVALPELKVGGMTGDSGWEAMINLFDVEEDIDWKANGCLNMKQLYNFRFTDQDGNEKEIFGRIFDSIDHLPEPLTGAVLKSDIWVKFSQMQINNDDPSIFYECKEKVFFEKHPEYIEDNTRVMLYVAQFEQGCCCYFPIKKAQTI